MIGSFSAAVDFAALAERVLSGGEASRDEALAVLAAPDDALLPLLQAAFRVRERHRGRNVALQVLINAKSGVCREDCGYCSQSAVSKAVIERHRLLPKADILAGAKKARDAGAIRFCIVTSGRSPSDAELDAITDAVRDIKKSIGIPICCSLGFLDDRQAKVLKDAGANRINHNLNTSERYHSRINTTHAWRDRLETLRAARGAGLELCSGGIVGMGEMDGDVADLALALREVKPDSIPVNFFHPVAGTPLAGVDGGLTPRRCLKVLAMFRFVHPAAEIRVAGGREHHLRSLQSLALYAADSFFIGGYLTTPGMGREEMIKMIEDAGFVCQLNRSAELEMGTS
ncbi:MAG: biotin synthase BioB [Planctomycetota bacterium]